MVLGVKIMSSTIKVIAVIIEWFLLVVRVMLPVVVLRQNHPCGSWGVYI